MPTTPSTTRRTTYEQVTYRDGDSQRRVILENPTERTIRGLSVVVGAEVDREGCYVQADAEALAAHGAADGTKRAIIETALIVRRTPMVMDLKRGELRVGRAG